MERLMDAVMAPIAAAFVLIGNLCGMSWEDE